MAKDLVAVGNTVALVRKRALTPAQYADLADVPPELEWLANITNPKTRWAGFSRRRLSRGGGRQLRTAFTGRHLLKHALQPGYLH